MKILLSAYACHPDKGSETGVGWGWLNQLSKDNQIWLLFYDGQGQEKAVREVVSLLPQKDNIHLTPISVPKFFQDRFYRVRYEIWQKNAYLFARKLVTKQHIDIIHHVTIAAWWNCGYLWKLKAPFIFGPISGFQKIPLKALGFLRTDGILSELIRTIMLFVFSHLHWNFNKAIKKAKIIFCANEPTYNYLISNNDEKKIKILPEIGVLESEIHNKKEIRANTIFTLVWSGNIIHRKNFGLLYEALKNMPQNIKWKLVVLGAGKLLNYWKRIISNSRLRENILFMGNVSLNEVKKYYNEADIFVFPSLREATGTVVLEAMSSGLPTITLKLNGAKILLNDKCGILIEVENKQQMIQDFTNAIVKLYENPILREEMGRNAQERAKKFTWEEKGRFMNGVYEKLVSER